MSNCNIISGNIPGCAPIITLPGSQGPTGAAGPTGVAGTSLLFNDFTQTASSHDTNNKVYITKTLAAGELSGTGDALEIEAMFTILAGVSGEFYITFGTATTKISTYTVNSPLLTNTIIKLNAVVTRTGASTQKVVGCYTVVGLSDATGTIPITTASETLANALVVDLRAQKSAPSISAGDIVSEYLRIKKLKI